MPDLRAAPEDLWATSGAEVVGLADVWAGFPDVWEAGGIGHSLFVTSGSQGRKTMACPSRYPWRSLLRLAGEGVEWQVPGLREELVLALLRALPKDLRRELVPVANTPRSSSPRPGRRTGRSLRCSPSR